MTKKNNAWKRRRQAKRDHNLEMKKKIREEFPDTSEFMVKLLSLTRDPSDPLMNLAKTDYSQIAKLNAAATWDIEDFQVCLFREDGRYLGDCPLTAVDMVVKMLPVRTGKKQGFKGLADLFN